MGGTISVYIIIITNEWPTCKRLKTAYFLGWLLSIIQISCQMTQKHVIDIKKWLSIWWYIERKNFLAW